MTSSERRLHPSSILFEVGVRLPRFALPGILLLFAVPSEEHWRNTAVWLVWGGVAMLFVLHALVHYLRFSYRYEAEELVIRSGILTRNERSIPYARIQNLDAAQNLVHQLFDVAVVSVQTGGGAEPEATLRVLPASALKEMRGRVLAAGGRTSGGPAEESALPEPPTSSAEAAPIPVPAATPSTRRTLLALEPRDLVLAGFIENRGMVLIAGALALLEQTGAIRRLIERLFDEEQGGLRELVGPWLGGAEVTLIRGAFYAVITLLVILLFIRLLSTVWAIVRLYDFRLEREGDELHMEYGLLTRVSATIPLRRVQTVIVRDGVLHRLLGRRQVLVETAGGIVLETGARQREPIAPILRVEQLPMLLHELHPGLSTDGIDWQPVHPRAFGRILRGSLLWPAGLSLAAFLLLQEWALAVSAILLGGAFGYALLRARCLAWSLTHDAVVARDGALTRTVRVARFSRVQVVALERNPFDLRLGMARVRADTAGARGGVVVPFLPEATATALTERLAARTAATAFTW